MFYTLILKQNFIISFVFTVDNLVIIGGFVSSGRTSDVDLLSIPTNSEICDPLDLEYSVYGHSSVATKLGILTCGGLTLDPNTTYTDSTTTCSLQTKDGQTTTFPPMKRRRVYFGLGIVNDVVYAVGGEGSPTTMEFINTKIDSEWTLKNLNFSVADHCVVTTKNSLVITGGVEIRSNSNFGWVNQKFGFAIDVKKLKNNDFRFST